jgi:hypothetical protein
MTTISIVPEMPGTNETVWRAMSGGKKSFGRTAGEALDALTPQLDEATSGAVVVVQQMRPDQFFSAEQQQRLSELMARWRAARDAGSSLSIEEQTELERLVEAELRAAGRRAEQAPRDLNQ